MARKRRSALCEVPDIPGFVPSEIFKEHDLERDIGHAEHIRKAPVQLGQAS